MCIKLRQEALRESAFSMEKQGFLIFNTEKRRGICRNMNLAYILRYTMGTERNQLNGAHWLAPFRKPPTPSTTCLSKKDWY